MVVVRWILCAAIGYLLGNIQTGLLIGRWLGKQDLREHGSGSTGATNALRVLGSQSALLTLLGDFLKGVLASAIGLYIGGPVGAMCGCLFVVVGHIWPVFFGFEGGKGVAASIGGLLVIFPIQTLIMVAVGVVVILVTKVVSLGSLAGALIMLVTGTITSLMSLNLVQLVFIILMVILVFFAHRENIDRIRKGTESKLSGDMFKKK